jgi:hypothetical protein
VKGISTQAAVIIAGGLIGAGLIVGLRGRPSNAIPSSSDGTPRTAPSSAATGREEQRSASPSAAESTSASARDERARGAREEALKALTPQMAAFRRKCWEPSLKKAAEPPRVTLVLNYTFDADGEQLARGISDVAGASRPDVTNCVGMELQPISIPPPGARTYVEVPFTLP